VTPLGWVLIGVFVIVIVILGAAGALKFGDWLDRRKRREAKRREAEPEDVW
jgi:hypothetical protein